MSALFDMHQISGTKWENGNSRLYFKQEAPPNIERRFQYNEIEKLHEDFACAEAEQHRLMAEIGKLYVVYDERAVSDYLHTHRRLPQLLINAMPHLQRSFGYTVVSLRSTVDDTGWQMLYATVHWRGEPLEALKALDEFDSAWWLANSYPAGTALTFTYVLV